MTRILAVLRRIFMIGVISLIISGVMLKKNVFEIVPIIFKSTGLVQYIMIFLAVSPVLFILFCIISAIYIRKHGLSAAYQSERPFVETLFKMFLSDISSPIRMPIKLISTFFKKNSFDDYLWKESRKVYGRRVIFEIIFILACMFSVAILNWNL